MTCDGGRQACCLATHLSLYLNDRQNLTPTEFNLLPFACSNGIVHLSFVDNNEQIYSVKMVEKGRSDRRELGHSILDEFLYSHLLTD